MKRWLSVVAVVAAVAITTGAGVLHGRLTHRWGPPADLVAASKRLDSVPSDFGNWRAEESKPLGDVVVRVLQCAGYINRTYVNHETGESVNVAILLGPPGPISVDTPEVCYSSRDLAVIVPAQRVSVRGADKPEEQFWALTFRSHNVTGDELRVYYAWTVSGLWQAPEEPRITFGGEGMLYKIQLAAGQPAGSNSRNRDPCLNFLRDFLPVVDRAMFSVGGG